MIEKIFSVKKVLLFVFATIISFAQELKAQGNQQYNVVFIAVDDMNERLNFLGFPEVLTPNLQRLVNKGMVFTNNYCQQPICNPSRTSFMSSWRPDKTKVTTNNNDPAVKVPAGVRYLQEHLHYYGYRTERYGKVYHGDFEYEFSWDYAEGSGGNGGDKPGSVEGQQYPGASWGIFPTDDTFAVDYLQTESFVSRLKQGLTQPSFLMLGLSTHNPFVPSIENWDIYGDPTKKERLPIWDLPNKISGNSSRNFTLPNTPVNDRDDIPSLAFFSGNTIIETDEDWKNLIHAYYGEVSQLDKCLGVVFDEFDRQNLWSNTIVVFTSDHGQHLGEHNGVWLKNTLFNESLHVPLVIYVPGKNPGTTNKLTELVDIYPTITELCKVPTPKDIEGVSLVRLMDNPNQQWKSGVFSQVNPDNQTKGRSVISQQFHYNNWGTSGEELYDRTNDPHEYTNLALNAAYTATLNSMRNTMNSGWRSVLPPGGDSATYYKDQDDDGYGNADSSFKGIYQPLHYVTDKTDCNDFNAAIFPPKAKIKADGSTDICATGKVTLKANKTNGIYAWYKNNVLIANANTKTYKAVETGSYKVTITQNGCSTSSSAITVYSSCKKAADKNKVAILQTVAYPNPSKGDFKIKYSADAAADIVLSVYDMQGKLLFSQPQNIHSGNNILQLHCTSLSNGVYDLIIQNGKRNVHIKLIIQK